MLDDQPLGEYPEIWPTYNDILRAAMDAAATDLLRDLLRDWF